MKKIFFILPFLSSSFSVSEPFLMQNNSYDSIPSENDYACPSYHIGEPVNLRDENGWVVNNNNISQNIKFGGYRATFIETNSDYPQKIKMQMVCEFYGYNGSHRLDTRHLLIKEITPNMGYCQSNWTDFDTEPFTFKCAK